MLLSCLKQLWRRFLTILKTESLVFCISNVTVLQLSLVMTRKKLPEQKEGFTYS